MSVSPHDLIAQAKALTSRRVEAQTGIVRWCPQKPTPAQQVFLALDNAEALYGGAAGGGKSSALLMDVLQYVDVPGFQALVLRRTYADLSLPGAIMDRAGDWLRPTGATWHDMHKRWSFPSGAALTFGYLDTEKDKYRYQGAEFQRIAFDELTQFSETQYLYLQSRLRRVVGLSVKPASRAGSNPGGSGHDWVFARFVDPAKRLAGAQFVPAKLGDNPHVRAEEYRATLALLDETTRAQLEDGLWVRDSGGQLHQFDVERNVVDELPALPRGAEWSYAFGVDLGSAVATPTLGIVVIAWQPHDDTVYVVLSMALAGQDVTDVAERLNDLSHAFPPERIVMDQGGLGGMIISELGQRFSIPAEPVQKSNKLGFRRLLNAALKRGKIKVVRDTNAELIAELLSLQWNADGTDAQKGQPDHMSDAVLYVWRTATAFQPTEAPPAPPQSEGEAVARMAAAARDRDARRNDGKRRRWLR